MNFKSNIMVVVTSFKSCILCVMLLFITYTGYCQNYSYHHRIKNLKVNNAGLFASYKIEATNDGGFVIANVDRNSYDIIIVKIDICGEIEWAKRFSKFPNILISGLLVDKDGDIITFCQLFGAGVNSYVYAIKLNPKGNILWHKRYNFEDGTGFGKADFHIASDGRYCFGGNYVNYHHTFFVNPLNGDIDDGFRLIGSGYVGSPFFSNLPNGNLLIRTGWNWVSYNLITENIDSANGFMSYGAWRYAKYTIFNNLIVVPLLPPTGSEDNRFTLLFFDLDRNYLFNTPAIAGHQHSYNNSSFFPYKFTTLPNKRLAVATTQKVPDHQITLLVFDSIGRQIQTKHFHSESNVFRMAHDQTLLTDGSMAILGESDGFIEVIKISLDSNLLLCESDTSSVPVKNLTINLVPVPDVPIRLEKVQLKVESFDISEHNINLEVEKNCNTSVPVFDADTTIHICKNNTLLVFASKDSLATCKWDDGYEGCNRLLTFEGGSKIATVKLDCLDYNYRFWVQEKTDCPCKIYFPNVFSPDRLDNSNNNFNPISECEFAKFDLKIFNRWGDLVFSSIDKDVSWNGFIKGIPASPGVFTYFLKYQTSNDQTEASLVGNVTVLR